MHYVSSTPDENSSTQYPELNLVRINNRGATHRRRGTGSLTLDKFRRPRSTITVVFGNANLWRGR